MSQAKVPPGGKAKDPRCAIMIPHCGRNSSWWPVGERNTDPGGWGGAGSGQAVCAPLPGGAQGKQGDALWEQGLRSGDLRSVPRHSNQVGLVFTVTDRMDTQMTEGSAPTESTWGPSASTMLTDTMQRFTGCMVHAGPQPRVKLGPPFTRRGVWGGLTLAA